MTMLAGAGAGAATGAGGAPVVAASNERHRRERTWVHRWSADGPSLWYHLADGALHRTRPDDLDRPDTVLDTREATTGAPLKVYVDLTNRCNLSCRHCISDSGPHVDTSAELGTDRLLALVDELAGMGVLEIASAGGEPFLHPDWERVFRRVSERGMNLMVTTNGLLLGEHALEVLREIQPLEVRVSFDGGPRLHEHVRGAHTYARSMRTVARMVDAGLSVTGRLTLCAGGDDELGVLFGDLTAAGVRTVKVAVAKSAGRGATDTGRHLVRKLPDPDVASLLRRLADEAGLELRLAADDFPAELHDGVLSKLRDVDRPSCGAGTDTAYVTPRGELLGCVAIPDRPFGELHTASFSEVWAGRAAQHYRQDAEESGARRLCDALAQPMTPSGAIMVGMPRRRPDRPR